ncbi:MAG: hypothetical protein QOJ34_2267, partial [Pseudonocardiales bacterium]|nr:hypothetical protein [Pseudonocardiales bacterium]
MTARRSCRAGQLSGVVTVALTPLAGSPEELSANTAYVY